MTRKAFQIPVFTSTTYGINVGSPSLVTKTLLNDKRNSGLTNTEHKLRYYIKMSDRGSRINTRWETVAKCNENY